MHDVQLAVRGWVEAGLPGIPRSRQSEAHPVRVLRNRFINFGALEFAPPSGNQDEEDIELTNPNSIAVDISDGKLDGGIEFTFQGGTVIPAGSSPYVSPDVTVC